MWKAIPWPMVAVAVVGVALTVLIGGPLVREMVPGKIPMGDGSDLTAPSGPYVHAHCPHPCRVGSHVNIMAGQTSAPAWVAVYADSSSAPRIWYYPTESGTSPQVPVRDTVRALSEDFRISPAHNQAAHWELHLLMTNKPVDRAAVDGLSSEFVIAHETFQLSTR